MIDFPLVLTLEGLAFDQKVDYLFGDWIIHVPDLADLVVLSLRDVRGGWIPASGLSWSGFIAGKKISKISELGGPKEKK